MALLCADLLSWKSGTMTAGIIKLTEQQFYAFVEDKLDGVGPPAGCRRIWLLPPLPEPLCFPTLGFL